MEEYTPKHSDNPTPDKKKINKIIYAVVAAIAAAVLIIALIVLGIKFFGGREDFGDFKNNISSTSSAVLPANPIDFKEIQAKNPDVCAWIQVDGIDIIDYPILQSAAEADDNYYLNHDINHVEKLAGSIYIQKLNSKDFDDPNTLIYGHNMLNGTMFGQLKKFRNKEFFNENRNIYIYTPGHILKYEIISAFIYDDRHIINSFNFDLETSRMQFFDECTNPTSFTKQVLDGATLDADDKIITLSTCTSNDSERYLVVGKLVSDTQTVYSGLVSEIEDTLESEESASTASTDSSEVTNTESSN